MTLDGPFCETFSYTSTHVTFYCHALAQNGTAPYTYNWNGSKGIAVSPLTEPSVYATCTRGTPYLLKVGAYDANFVFREKSLGWQTCQLIVD